MIPSFLTQYPRSKGRKIREGFTLWDQDKKIPYFSPGKESCGTSWFKADLEWQKLLRGHPWRFVLSKMGFMSLTEEKTCQLGWFCMIIELELVDTSFSGGSGQILHLWESSTWSGFLRVFTWQLLHFSSPPGEVSPDPSLQVHLLLHPHVHLLTLKLFTSPRKILPFNLSRVAKPCSLWHVEGERPGTALSSDHTISGAELWYMSSMSVLEDSLLIIVLALANFQGPTCHSRLLSWTLRSWGLRAK